MKREKIYYDLDYIKKEELNILILFDELCKKYNLRYTLSGGTLLGAVRHGGFIPWDDDIDVIMPRNDFEKFSKVFSKEFDETFFLQIFSTDPQYLNNFGKIINLKIPAYTAETENLNIKRGICIDVFPIDKVPENIFTRKKYLLCMSICSILKYSLLVQETEGKLKKGIHKCCSLISKMVGTEKINRWENRIRTKYNNSSSHITFADFIKPPYKLTKKDIYPYRIFQSYSKMLFEGHTFSVIKDYEQYLYITYGDYMSLPPKAKRIPEHNFYHY